jgi:hypothetical protein
VASIAAAAAKARASATPAIFDDPGFARKMGFAGTRVRIKSSTRLQCDRMRRFQRKFFSFASTTRGEQSIRPKISRIDFDVTERENFKRLVGTSRTSG